MELTVALVGCGTVGAAAAQLLVQKPSDRARVALSLKYIVDIDFSNAERTGLDPSLFCSDYDRVLKDDSVDAVVELVGGIGAAKEIILRAASAGKHIVTANKALLAHHGGELLAAARKAGVCICFEASCGGGIPIVRALTEGLIANRITALYGILNGTCNYILTAMGQESKSYATALEEAQEAGYAEADPTLDVSGLDTAHKLAILASLAFGKRINLDMILVQGIDALMEQDLAYGQELGYVMKLLAIARHGQKGLNLYVRPTFISKEHPLAWVSGPFNAVSVYGNVTGHTLYYGRGAGGIPTASAVLADLYSLAEGAAQRVYESTVGLDRAEETPLLAMEELDSRYYIRVNVEDRPGVLAQIAASLGNHRISISSVLQKEVFLPPESYDEAGVPVVITTHEAREGSVKAALREIDELQTVKTPSVCIEMMDEHAEYFP